MLFNVDVVSALHPQSPTAPILKSGTAAEAFGITGPKKITVNDWRIRIVERIVAAETGTNDLENLAELTYVILEFSNGGV
jgi:hypothetical protein